MASRLENRGSEGGVQPGAIEPTVGPRINQPVSCYGSTLRPHGATRTQAGLVRSEKHSRAYVGPWIHQASLSL